MNNKFDMLKVEDSGDEDVNGQPKEKSKKVALPGEHPLQFNYAFWFSRRSPGKQTSYDQNLKQIIVVASVEQFWQLYSHVMRPSDLGTGHSDYHLFKEGIRPMWEDEANKAGGKWIVRLRKGIASRCWENLILAMLGEQFMVGEEICGSVISIRYQEDILSLWNRTASDQVTTSRIRDTLKRVLNLPPNTIMEYKTHTDSLKDNSSYRNTDVFMRWTSVQQRQYTMAASFNIIPCLWTDLMWPINMDFSGFAPGKTSDTTLSSINLGVQNRLGSLWNFTWRFNHVLITFPVKITVWCHKFNYVSVHMCFCTFSLCS